MTARLYFAPSPDLLSLLLPHCSDLNLEFEIPFRELGFNGVPFRSTAFVMPTVNCLVELVEMPFTVVAIPEVAIVNLERVGFNLRNFDMVIIFKVRRPQLSTIPVSCAISRGAG